jgi:hypothetical protein
MRHQCSFTDVQQPLASARKTPTFDSSRSASSSGVALLEASNSTSSDRIESPPVVESSLMRHFVWNNIQGRRTSELLHTTGAR